MMYSIIPVLKIVLLKGIFCLFLSSTIKAYKATIDIFFNKICNI